MRHGLLRWWRPGELDDGQREVYDAIVGGPRGRATTTRGWPLADVEGRLNGPFNAMVAAGGVGMAVQRLGAAIRYESGLPARLRELAILELARLRGSEIEWRGHEGPARAAGLTDAELADVRAGRVPDGFAETERVLMDVVRRLVLDRELPEATATAAVAAFGERGFLETVYCVGYYDMLALAMAASRTPLPDQGSS
ncbi:MAG TPA: carboxymuconolactone decarboxylase family protein [Pseudonocardiaceae bacterium]|nr:carboxymuconolactone decarboxylase family protein [Pseudonocardiaceae bacterium]